MEKGRLAAITLSWTPPEQNDDGTPLMDLAGFVIYYGPAGEGDYQNSITIDNPGITTYVLDNLPTGTYSVVATAYNSKGLESGYSNEVVSNSRLTGSRRFVLSFDRQPGSTMCGAWRDKVCA